MTTQVMMTTEQIANRFHELAQSGKWDEIQEELYSPEAVSIEPEGSTALGTVSGIDAIRKKGKDWSDSIEEFHSGHSGKPQVAGDYFVCTMGFDATFKGQGRMKMDEVALYRVKDGKIISEQFFY